MTIRIKAITPDEVAALVPRLADLLKDAVDHGAGVNFMAGVTLRETASYWERQLPGFRSGDRAWLVAERDGVIIGTVMCLFAQQPNQPFRAEISKMLVHSAHRRLGVGAMLMSAIEAAALAAGRTLLVLDTVTGSAGDRLYRRMGWTCFGVVPGYAFLPDGTPEAASFFYKQLQPVDFS
jgi:GNAT superfamily N-acetyltransferase